MPANPRGASTRNELKLRGTAAQVTAQAKTKAHTQVARARARHLRSANTPAANARKATTAMILASKEAPVVHALGATVTAHA
jgi:hypothetical protein